MFFLKNLISKKIPAVFVTVAILFITVFSMSLFASAATSFTPRLSAPSSDNEYYYSNKNVFYKYGYGMPNCTAYAYGRAYEILKTEPKLSWGNAEDWYGYNKSNGYYSYGSTPKIGAIACWSYNGGGGHVAVVEKIESNTITLSNSAYSGTNFYLTYADVSDPKVGGSSWWNFQGFIYIGDFDAASTTAPTTTQITYKTGIYQTEVDSTLNMRSGAGTNYSYVASIPNGVKLTVTQVKKAGGYTWGYTAYKGNTGWVALDYCKYISDIPATEPSTATPTTQTETTKPVESGLGDVNFDGKISVLDATEIQKYVAGLITLSDEQLDNCDFDFDGRITVMDATAIQKYLSK